MKRSNRLVILVGVLLAVLAFILVVVFLNQAPTAEGPEVPKVPVLIAKEDIAIGDAVTPDKVEVREVDEGQAIGTPIGDTSGVAGERALFDVPAGSQVYAEVIGRGAEGVTPSIETLLEPGEKAVAFQVERVTGLDFLVRPGDHIDIVLSQQVQVLQPALDQPAGGAQRFETIPGLENARTVKTILTDRRVLYVSETRARAITNQPTPSPGEAAPAEQATQEIENVIIVFAGSDQDAEVIKFAQNDLSELGSLTAVIRRAADAEEEVPEEDTTGITLDILFEDYGIPIPNIITNLGPEGARR